MTPSAEPTPTAAAQSLAPAGVLEDGEIVLLAIKPSAWFVPLISWPVLLAAGVVAAGVQFLSGVLGSPAWRHTLLTACATATVLRLVIAAVQWTGRLYMLTNRRVLTIRGVVRPVIAGCRLKQISSVLPAAILLERGLGLGSLLFDLAGGDGAELNWLHVNRPAEVLRTVQEAIGRAR